jgi:hypothetical protein
MSFKEPRGPAGVIHEVMIENDARGAGLRKAPSLHGSEFDIDEGGQVRRTTAFLITCLLILVSGVPTRAEHDSSRIKAGTIQAGRGSSISGAFAVSGTDGLTFDAFFESGTSDATCGPCTPGQTISLTSVMSPAYWGTARYQGKTYTFDFETGGGWFAVEAPPIVLPAVAGTEPATVEVSSPFSLGAESNLFLQSGTNGEVMRNVTLSGGGTATATFSVFYDEVEQTHFYFFESLRFEFSR